MYAMGMWECLANQLEVGLLHDRVSPKLAITSRLNPRVKPSPRALNCYQNTFVSWACAVTSTPPVLGRAHRAHSADYTPTKFAG